VTHYDAADLKEALFTRPLRGGCTSGGAALMKISYYQDCNELLLRELPFQRLYR
jgi:hypothetical protein